MLYLTLGVLKNATNPAGTSFNLSPETFAEI
jgi:hypothetical protein